jgi:hypothetical protein
MALREVPATSLLKHSVLAHVYHLKCLLAGVASGFKELSDHGTAR